MFRATKEAVHPGTLLDRYVVRSTGALLRKGFVCFFLGCFFVSQTVYRLFPLLSSCPDFHFSTGLSVQAVFFCLFPCEPGVRLVLDPSLRLPRSPLPSGRSPVFSIDTVGPLSVIGQTIYPSFYIGPRLLGLSPSFNARAQFRSFLFSSRCRFVLSPDFPRAPPSGFSFPPPPFSGGKMVSTL